jgi:hypothetical protein
MENNAIIQYSLLLDRYAVVVMLDYSKKNNQRIANTPAVEASKVIFHICLHFLLKLKNSTCVATGLVSLVM